MLISVVFLCFPSICSLSGCWKIGRVCRTSSEFLRARWRCHQPRTPLKVSNFGESDFAGRLFKTCVRREEWGQPHTVIKLPWSDCSSKDIVMTSGSSSNVLANVLTMTQVPHATSTQRIQSPNQRQIDPRRPRSEEASELLTSATEKLVPARARDILREELSKLHYLHSCSRCCMMFLPGQLISKLPGPQMKSVQSAR